MSDYVNLSQLSYDVDGVVSQILKSAERIDTYKIKNDIPRELEKNNKMKDLEFLDYFHDSNGVSGSAFKNQKTGEVVISFTGTNEGKDWINNLVGAGLGLYDYCRPAYAFYEKIQNEYGEKITLTGHSQGGGIAQRVAIEYNVQKTVVFNAAPLYTRVLVIDDLNRIRYSNLSVMDRSL